MIFEFLFKKNIDKKVKVLCQEILENNEKLKKQLKLEQLRFHNSKTILNDKVKSSTKNFIKKTDNGIDIIISVSENEKEVEVYNIDHRCQFKNDICLWVKVYSKTRRRQVFIKQYKKSNDESDILTPALRSLLKILDKDLLSEITEKIDFDSCTGNHIIKLFKRMNFEFEYYYFD